MKQLFGNKIKPCCLYCEFGKTTSQSEIILCPNKGVVSQSFACRKYQYSPFKRKPKRVANLPQFEEAEFTL